MKFIGFEREDEAEQWARDKVGAKYAPSLFRAMSAVDAKNEFSCVVVFTNFTPRNIDLNVAAVGKNWASPKETVKMFNHIFTYAFHELRASRTTALVKASNEATRAFVEHLGFKLEGVMRDAFEDDDLCIYGFLASEFRTHQWYRGH